MATIKVKATATDNTVVLWERHADHPNGEIFIRADGQTYQVAETPQIRALLKNGQLVKVAKRVPTRK